MAEILIRHLLFGFIIFTFFIVGGMSMIGEMAQKNPDFATDPSVQQFNVTLDKYADLTSSVKKVETGVGESAEGKGSPGDFGFLNTLITGGYNLLTGLFTSFTFMGEAITGIAAVFALPSWMPVLIGFFITIIVAFGIYTAIFQREI